MERDLSEVLRELFDGLSEEERLEVLEEARRIKDGEQA